MRITIVTPLYPPDLGKLAIYTKELATQLTKQHAVQLVTYSELPETIPGVQIFSVSKQLPLLIRLFTFTARLWRASHQTDLLYVCDGASVGLPSLMIGWLRGIPVVRCLLDDEARERAERALYVGIPEETFALLKEINLKTRFIRSLQNWVLRRAKQIVLPSQHLQDILERAYHIPSKKLNVIPFPPVQPQRVPFLANRQSLQIFSHSPLNFFSGVEDLLVSLAQVKKTIPEAKLIVANTGPEVPRLKQRAAELGIEKNVEFTGQISRAEFWHLLRSSSVFVRNQTSSNSADEIYQAYQAQIPVIASRIPCHTEAIRDQVSGILIEPNAAPDLTQALVEILEQAALRARFIAGGEGILAERGEWKEHIQHILSLV